MRSPLRDHILSDACTTSPLRPHPAGRAVFDVGLVVAGRYRVVRRIAAGGMGEVYEVDDQELRDRVALKTVRGDRAHDRAALERFRREIQLARKITHPNVCRIFDVGFHADSAGEAVPFLTMELLAGETLAAYITRRGPMPPAEAMPLVEQMVAGLDAAHHAGVIHRDFKSHNVMLVSTGAELRVVITDFGLARTLVRDDDADTTSVTGPPILGTPAYMAPEQVIGAPVNERTDLYALGIVLFEMVTGQLPFDGETPMSIAAKRLCQPPPSPAALAPDLDPRWTATIERCLALDPPARFASVGDVVRALRGELATAAETVRVRRVRLPRPAFAAAAVAAVVLIGIAIGRGRPDAPPAPTQTQAQALTASAGPLVAAARHRRPPPTGTPYARGLEHLRRWEGARARAALEEAVAAAPRDADVGLALCRAYLMERDLPRASAEAQRGLALAGVGADTRRWLEACRLSASGNDTAAAAIYREAFTAAPSLELGILLAMTQSDACDATGLESTLAALAALPAGERDDVRVASLEADPRYLQGDYTGASQRWAQIAPRAEAEGLPMVQAIALHNEAFARRILGELPAASERMERAHQLYVDNGERGRLAELLTVQTTVLYDLGEHRRSIRVRQEALALYERAGNPTMAVATRIGIAEAQFLTGDHRAGRRGIEEAARRAVEDGVPWRHERTDFDRGWERLHAGDARAARRLTAAARGIAEPGTDPYQVAYYEWNNGEAALLAGDFKAARAALEHATGVASGSRFRTSAECTRVLLAATALAEGKPVEAEALARHAVAELDRMAVRDCRTRGRVVLAGALRALDKPDAAHAVLGDAAAIAPPTEDVWIRWELEVALAEDEIAHGETGPARDRLTAVLVDADRLDIPGAALAAAVVLGELELADPATAAQGRARLLEAARRASELGQLPMEQRARAALR